MTKLNITRRDMIGGVAAGVGLTTAASTNGTLLAQRVLNPCERPSC
jgi:hypothetical protein